jgi:hypothetical protein
VDLASPLVDLERVHRVHPDVLREVVAYDPQVTVYWQRTEQCWCLAHTSWNGTFRFLKWPEPNLSMEVVRWMERADQWRRPQPTSRQEMDDDLWKRQKRSEAFHDNLRHAALENRRQLGRALELIDRHLT